MNRDGAASTPRKQYYKGRHCAASNCHHVKGKDNCGGFRKMPNDPVERRLWMFNFGMKEEDYRPGRWQFCVCHFACCQRMKTNHVHVPTLNLPNGIRQGWVKLFENTSPSVPQATPSPAIRLPTPSPAIRLPIPSTSCQVATPSQSSQAPASKVPSQSSRVATPKILSQTSLRSSKALTPKTLSQLTQPSPQPVSHPQPTLPHVQAGKNLTEENLEVLVKEERLDEENGYTLADPVADAGVAVECVIDAMDGAYDELNLFGHGAVECDVDILPDVPSTSFRDEVSTEESNTDLEQDLEDVRTLLGLKRKISALRRNNVLLEMENAEMRRQLMLMSHHEPEPSQDMLGVVDEVTEGGHHEMDLSELLLPDFSAEFIS